MISNKSKKYLQSIPDWGYDIDEKIPDSFLVFVLYSSFYDDFCSKSYELTSKTLYKEELKKYLEEYNTNALADTLCLSKIKECLLNTFDFIRYTVDFALDIFFIYKLDIGNFFSIVNGALYDAYIDFFNEQEEKSHEE